MNPREVEELKQLLLAIARENNTQLEEVLAAHPDATQVLRALNVDNAFLTDLRIATIDRPKIDNTASAPTPADEEGQLLRETVQDLRSPVGIGTTISNRYELVKVIGEGGMGKVFLARQTEPVKRQVALKLIRGGMDSKGVLARFDAERQALALMDHPGIARVYDGGKTESGQPYFVMELVEGVPITQYCDEHKLSVKLRLELFVSVCHAVQHAHQKGIIHRDLKPGNVLVTEIDGRATPKVIDFGVAKAIDIKLTEKTIADFGAIVGTPDYMSPEQADPSTIDIDTRSDVYALGVILYEVLTGSRPFRTHGSKPPAVLEILRMVRETEPLRPSSRVSRADTSLTIAEKRNTDPTRLSRLLQGDLDWIVLKALEKDRTRRYETANGLAADIRRHLSNEPVVARPPSATYRLQKTWQRNKLALSAAAIVVVTLVAGTGISTWAALKAIAAREAESNQKVAAESAKTSAVQAARLARTTVADMQTERGLLAAAEGDSATAMLWFANAAEQTPHDPARQFTNRLRAGHWMNELYRPAASMRFQAYGWVKRLEFQPRGPLVLTSKPGSVQIWNWELEQSLEWADRLKEPKDACWSPDGRSIAVGFASGELQIRTVPVGNLARTLKTPEAIETVAYLPDGKRLITAGRTVQVWNLSDEPTIERSWEHPNVVHSLRLNRGGTLLATACRDQMVRVYDIDGPPTNPAPRFAVPHAPGLEIAPVFMDADRTLITVMNKEQIGWWDVQDGRPAGPPSLDARASRSEGLAASPNGDWFAATSYEEATVWDLRGQRTVIPHRNPVKMVSISPDGTTLVTGCDDWTIRLWSRPIQRTPAFSVPHQEGPTQMAVSADGRLLAVTGWDRIRIWRRPDHQLVVGTSWTPQDGRARVGFDGRWATLGRWHEGPFGNLPSTPTLTVFDLANGRPASPPIPVNTMIDSCLCGDNRSIAVISGAGNSGELTFYEVLSGRQLRRPIAFSDQLQSVAARPGHADVAVLCARGRLTVINHEDGTQRFDFLDNDLFYGRPFPRVTYSPDGTNLVVLTKSHEVVVRDAETGKLRYPPIRPMSSVPETLACRAIAISPDSRWLATAVTGTNVARVWDLATGEPVGAPLPHPGDFYGIFSIAFSPDGNWLISADKDGAGRVWDWRAGTMVMPPLRHADEVYDAAFTGDGRHALTAVRNGDVQVWELATAKMIAPPLRNPFSAQPWTNTIAIAGDRVVVGAAGYPIFDLKKVFEEPRLSVELSKVHAELISARRVQLGELSSLSEREWHDRWRDLRAAEFTPGKQAERLLARLDEAGDSTSRQSVAKVAMESELVLAELLALRPEIPQLHIAMAGLCDRPGDARAAAHRSRAIELFERQFDQGSLDESGERQLADCLSRPASAGWQVLQVIEAKSSEGAVLTRRPKGDVFVTGNHVIGDTYTLVLNCPLDRVAGVKLEVLPDEGLPKGGPGRHDSGNFQLASFRLFQPASAEPKRIPLVDAWASYTYPAPQIDILGVIDEHRNAVWHVFGRPGQPHQAVFAFAEPIKIEGDDRTLRIELQFNKNIEVPINLGCFRLSAIRSLVSEKFERDQAAILGQSPSSTLALGFAYYGCERFDKAISVLERAIATDGNPEAGIGLMLLAQLHQQLGQAEAARRDYDRFMKWRSQHAFPAPLKHRAAELMQAIGSLSREQVSALEAQQDIEAELTRLTRELERKPKSAPALASRADLLIRQGKWRDAASDCLSLKELVPNTGLAEMRAGVLYLLMDDREAYRSLVRNLVKQYGGTKDVELAERVCKTALLLPDTVPMADLPVAPVLEARKSGPDGMRAWYIGCSSLILLRDERFQEAVETSELLNDSPTSAAVALALVTKSMAQYHLKQLSAARQTLEKSNSMRPSELRGIGTKKFAGPPPYPEAAANHDWLILELLSREAEALIDSR